MRAVLFILGILTLTGCSTCTDYPYNSDSVAYYRAAPVQETLVTIPAHRYYQFDHQNQDYYHSTPIRE